MAAQRPSRFTAAPARRALQGCQCRRVLPKRKRRLAPARQPKDVALATVLHGCSLRRIETALIPAAAMVGRRIEGIGRVAEAEITQLDLTAIATILRIVDLCRGILPQHGSRAAQNGRVAGIPEIGGSAAADVFDLRAVLGAVGEEGPVGQIGGYGLGIGLRLGRTRDQDVPGRVGRLRHGRSGREHASHRASEFASNGGAERDHRRMAPRARHRLANGAGLSLADARAPGDGQKADHQEH